MFFVAVMVVVVVVVVLAVVTLAAALILFYFIGISMQTPSSSALLDISSHKIITKEHAVEERAIKWNDGEGSNMYQLSNSINDFMKEINAEYQRDINVLKMRFKALEYSAEKLKKALRIHSSLTSQQVI